MPNLSITYKPLGESAILLSWPEEISIDILQDIRRFVAKMEYDKNKFVLEYNFIFNTLLVTYDYLKVDFKQMRSYFEELYVANELGVILPKKNNWYIPVCYEEQFGIDLMFMADVKNCTIEELIQWHQIPTYTVYGIGFLPGFLYLGGLDEKLHFPRRTFPRKEVFKGSVGIGGMQTGIYPQASPGGWHIIGRTPVSLFDINKEIPCPIYPGDELKFYLISFEEFQRIESELVKGHYELKSLSHD